MKVSEYRKTTDVYTYYNPNPREDERKAWDTGDCVVRAFAVAADITWIEAFDKLAEVARREFRMINSKDCYRLLFEELVKTLMQTRREKWEARTRTFLTFSKKVTEALSDNHEIRRVL